MAWTPIRGPGDLPAEGKPESETLDLKRCYERNAKGQTSALRDIASFANAFGGTILVGAEEEPDTAVLKEYVGIPDADAEGRRIKQLALARLDPQPDVETVPIRTSDGLNVLAINVAPFPGVVGVRHEIKWEFYVRRERLNHAVTFGEAEKMLTQDRRGRLLIESIPKESWSQRITVDAYLRRIPRGKWSLKRLDAHNVVLACPGNYDIEIPYSFIKAVWPSGGDRFTISVDAAITRINPPNGPGGPYQHQFVVQGLRDGRPPAEPTYEQH